MPINRSAPKVFGIGLGRTGTTSLAQAMKMLGFSVKHAPSDVNEIEQYDFVNDIAAAWRFRFLDCVYPLSRFILTDREEDSWIKSCERHARGRGTRGSLQRLENRFMCYGRIDFHREDFRLVLQRHREEVFRHFESRPEKLLVMNICEGQGWDRLCPFLGVDAPPIPFPHRNRGKK